jgi:hypothetical protein
MVQDSDHPVGQRWLREETVAWAVLAIALALIVWAHGAFLAPAALFNIPDEGYIQAFAVRMHEGRMLPYVDAVSHRGPVLYWVAAAGVALLGGESFLSLRVLALLSMWSTVLLTFLAARAALRPFAGAVAAIAITLVELVAMNPGDGMAFNGESLLNVFAVGALLCATLGLRGDSAKPKRGYLALAGACATLGALCKQGGVVVVPALGVWVVAASVARAGLSRSERRWPVAAFAAGIVAAALVVGLPYAIAGELGTLYYYLFTYNVDVYVGVLTWPEKLEKLQWWLIGHSVQLSVAVALVAWGLMRPLQGGLRRTLHRWDEDGFLPTVALGAFLGLAVCNSTLRNFVHYYVQIVPWFGLLLGLALDQALRLSKPAPHRRRLRIAVIAPAVMAALVGWSWREDLNKRAQAGWRERVEPVCSAVQQHSTPDDALFVWGFRPDLYTWCQRRPASRYVYTTFVAGFVPWQDKMTKAREDALAVPGSRSQLLQELEATRPPVLIDAAKSLAGRSISRYERLAEYVARHYCHGGTRSGLDVLLRRRPDGSCPPALAPEKSTPVTPAPMESLPNSAPSE